MSHSSWISEFLVQQLYLSSVHTINLFLINPLWFRIFPYQESFINTVLVKHKIWNYFSLLFRPIYRLLYNFRFFIDHEFIYWMILKLFHGLLYCLWVYKMVSIFIRLDFFGFSFFQRSYGRILCESGIIIILLLFNIKLAQSDVISHHSFICNNIRASLRFFIFFDIVIWTYFTHVKDFTFIQLRKQILSVNLWRNHDHSFNFLLIPHIFLDLFHSKWLQVTSPHFLECFSTLFHLFLTIIPLL